MIVADTSPLIFLTKLGRLSLLGDLFGEVFIPKAVWDELTCEKDRAEVHVLKEAREGNWLNVMRNVKRTRPASLTTRMNEAEIQSLAVARHRGIAFVLVDDMLARRAAVSLGLKPVGTLGVLIHGVETGFLTNREAQGCLEQLPHLGFRASHELLLSCLKHLDRSKAG